MEAGHSAEEGGDRKGFVRPEKVRGGEVEFGWEFSDTAGRSSGWPRGGGGAFGGDSGLVALVFSFP